MSTADGGAEVPKGSVNDGKSIMQIRIAMLVQVTRPPNLNGAGAGLVQITVFCKSILHLRFVPTAGQKTNVPSLAGREGNR